MAFHYSCLTFLLLMCLAGRPKSTSAVKSCEYDKACGCDTDEGYIDLRPLSKTIPYAAAGKSGILQKYYWLPCKDFTQDSKTVGALQEISGSTTFDIGVHAKASSMIRRGIPTFTMTAGDGARKSFFACNCDESPDGKVLKYVNEDPRASYNFDITSKHCCPIPRGASKGGLSTGSVLLIIAFVLVCVYLIAGIGFQVGVRKAEGKERIPNIVFWSALPGLIKDGFRFTISCGKTAGYNQV